MSHAALDLDPISGLPNEAVSSSASSPERGSVARGATQPSSAARGAYNPGSAARGAIQHDLAACGAAREPRPDDSYRPGLSAPEVHELLQNALAALRLAERNAVLWFAEIRRRRLYRDLGYASLHQYAAEALGFSASKTSQFVRLAEALDGLPALRESIASGQIGWTKAREVVKVATPRNEMRWLAEAKRSSRRDLERKIARVRANKRAARLGDPRQTVLAMDSTDRESMADGQRTESRVIHDAAIMSQHVTLRFAPEDCARFEALLEKLWKVSARRRGAARLQKEQLVLAGLDTLLSNEMQERACELAGTQRPAQPPHHEMRTGTSTLPDRGSPEQNPERDPERNFTRVKSASPYQIVIYKCEVCGGGQVVTGRGRQTLSAAALAAASCDARILQQSREGADVPTQDGYQACEHAHFAWAVVA